MTKNQENKTDSNIMYFDKFITPFTIISFKNIPLININNFIYDTFNLKNENYIFNIFANTLINKNRDKKYEIFELYPLILIENMRLKSHDYELKEMYLEFIKNADINKDRLIDFIKETNFSNSDKRNNIYKVLFIKMITLFNSDIDITRKDLDNFDVIIINYITGIKIKSTMKLDYKKYLNSV